MRESVAGRVTHVSGAVVRAESTAELGLGEVVGVGDERLVAEVIALEETTATLQVYEETGGLAPGAPLFATGQPLQVELGPGLLGRVFDGIQRPLAALAELEGDFMSRGATAPALDREHLWEFAPAVGRGALVTGGAVLGSVQETPALLHRILVPPHVAGELIDVAPPGARRVGDIVARVRTKDGAEVALPLFHRWRVRAPRPFAERLRSNEPLVTGQRVLDTFFPLPRGGAAGMPGGFGTGKTIMQHQLCRWADADVIVYVGCGERGNEMTEMLRGLPELTDPRTGGALADRTVLVANTSNMPVPAREASIYTGVTIAEYYRDMGYHVVLLADSTSRWAEALREISGRLEEMPAEEGFPPYLSSRLAGFYERAGRVTTLAGSTGSVTLISAISPPGGDVTEPVTRHTQRFTRCFWTLDKELAEARVFPAVSITHSYSDVTGEIEGWWQEHVDPEWSALRRRALALLDQAGQVEATARLIGSEGLPERQKLLLTMGALIEEGFLRQSAYDPKDASCSPARQHQLLALLLAFYERAARAIDNGATAQQMAALPIVGELERAKSRFGNDELDDLRALGNRIEEQLR
jgi:V/A-type H+-transporting ATPase subunit A